MNETDVAQENVPEEDYDTIEELEEEVDDLEVLDLIEKTPDDDEKERKAAVLLPAFAPFMYSVFPVLLINKKMKILFANDACQRLFSGLFELPENHFIDIFGRAFEIDELREIRETILGAREGNSWKGKARIRHRNVATIQTRVYIFPAILSEAVPSEYVVMFDDVTEENRRLLRSVFLSLLEASKLKDNDTGKHILRVNKYALRMAQELFKSKNPKYNRIDKDFIDSIGFLASMHDVGKIGTPDDILNKEGPLSDWELSIMREHTKNGAFILSTYPDPMAKEIALSHHERWDGSGYPYQLSGEMIPLAARITTIADVYDALRMKRSYKPALSHEVTSQKMREGKNSHFDPFLLDMFSEIAKDFENIYDANKDG
jgi:putative two-component system response regulator